MLVSILRPFSSDFPQLPGLQHDLQHSRFVGLLVGGLEALQAIPSAGLGHVHVRQVLPLAGPLPPVRMPERPLVWLKVRETLPLAQPFGCQVDADGLRGLGRLGRQSLYPPELRGLKCYLPTREKVPRDVWSRGPGEYGSRLTQVGASLHRCPIGVPSHPAKRSCCGSLRLVFARVLSRIIRHRS